MAREKAVSDAHMATVQAQLRFAEGRCQRLPAREDISRITKALHHETPTSSARAPSSTTPGGCYASPSTTPGGSAVRAEEGAEAAAVEEEAEAVEARAWGRKDRRFRSEK